MLRKSLLLPCFSTDSLSQGYLGQLFGFRRVQNSTVNARDSPFILVWALDMIEGLYVQSVLAFYVGLIGILCCSVTMVPTASLYICREDCSAVTSKSNPKKVS
jgi:hypothetical protein